MPDDSDQVENFRAAIRQLAADRAEAQVKQRQMGLVQSKAQKSK